MRIIPENPLSRGSHSSAVPSKVVEEFDLDEFMASLRGTLLAWGLDAHAFNVRWYNDLRASVSPGAPQSIITDNPNAIGIVLISNRNFFREVVRAYTSEDPRSNFVDRTVDGMLAELERSLHPTLGAKLKNTDKPPYVHVQSIGHVAGIDEYVQATDDSSLTEVLVTARDAQLWKELSRKILGVSIHPRYGGWYAYRILITIEGVSWPSTHARPEPLSFLTSSQKAAIIREYNLNPDIGKWRDFNDSSCPIPRYDIPQYLFFHERSMDKRRRILELMRNEGGLDRV